MKSKVNVKSNYKIKSVTKELRLKENKFEPFDYILYKVTSPNKDVKYFSSRKDATAYVNRLTDNNTLPESYYSKVFQNYKNNQDLSSMQ